MSDIPDHMRKRREWPDGNERVCGGSVITFNNSRHGPNSMVVYEVPYEVHKLMKASEADEMLELHHHADIHATVYVRNEEIIAIDARWDKVED